MQFLYRKLARWLQANPKTVNRIIRKSKQSPYSHLKTRCGTKDYMNRYWLFNAYEDAQGNATKRNWIMRLLPSIRIHEIVLEDEDSHLHDHPWDAQTIILKGFYIEEVPNPEFCSFQPLHKGNPETLRRVRVAGDTAPIRYGQYHRITYISKDGPAITLFITFRYRGVWGFLVDGKKVPWREYLSRRSNAEVVELSREELGGIDE